MFAATGRTDAPRRLIHDGDLNITRVADTNCAMASGCDVWRLPIIVRQRDGRDRITVRGVPVRRRVA